MTRQGEEPIPSRSQLFPHLNTRISVPYDRAVNPVTGTNWEGVGIIPDVAVSADQALETAHLMALRGVRDGEIDPRRKFDLDWAIAELESVLHPVTVDSEVLASYVGTYGPRSLSMRDGQLFYQRAPGPPLRAIPMNATLFRFEGVSNFRLEVVLDESGQPVKLVGQFDNGRTDESPRSGG